MLPLNNVLELCVSDHLQNIDYPYFKPCDTQWCLVLHFMENYMMLAEHPSSPLLWLFIYSNHEPKFEYFIKHNIFDHVTLTSIQEAIHKGRLQF